MATVLVQPNSRHRRLFVSRRVVALVVILMWAVTTGLVGYLVLTPTTTSNHLVTVGAVGSFPPQTVTYVPQEHLYLVHFDRDQFIALFERSPWLQKAHGVTPDQCRVRWYLGPGQDSQYSYTRPGSGTADPIGEGFFRENCSGWVFDAHGNVLFGGSAPLDRYPLRITGENVAVDTSARDSSWWVRPPAY